jgi:hypothetical protein
VLADVSLMLQNAHSLWRCPGRRRSAGGRGSKWPRPSIAQRQANDARLPWSGEDLERPIAGGERAKQAREDHGLLGGADDRHGTEVRMVMSHPGVSPTRASYRVRGGRIASDTVQIMAHGSPASLSIAWAAREQ